MDSIRASDREAGRGATPPLPGFHGLVGDSAPMQALFQRITWAAALNQPVLLLGESGTGKGLVAAALHALSPRHAAPFARLNCGGFSRELLRAELFGHQKGAFTGAVAAHAGLLRPADHGTVFLDEIAELPLEAQAVLLHVLDDGEVRPIGSLTPERIDVRIVAATHRPLRAWAHEGRFREDLYFRLRGVVLRIPPLRERLEDLPRLVEHVRGALNARDQLEIAGCAPAALQRLATYPWPGNVRELEAVLREAMLWRRRGWIEPDDLALDELPEPVPPPLAPPSRLARPAASAEARGATALALAAHGPVTRRALAAACGISGELARQTLARLVADGALCRAGDGRQTGYVPATAGASTARPPRATGAPAAPSPSTSNPEASP